MADMGGGEGWQSDGEQKDIRPGATPMLRRDSRTSSRSHPTATALMELIRQPPVGGVLAGVATSVGFALLHHILISDIWFSLAPMAIAGAICGGSLAWSYSLLFPRPALGNWFGYISLQTSLLLLLGAVSVATFDPIVPMAVLMAANEPPHDLISKALPLTGAFVLIAGLPRTNFSSSPHPTVDSTPASRVSLLMRRRAFPPGANPGSVS